MFCKSALLAAAFMAMTAVDAADIEAQLLKKVVEYEANKAAEAIQLAEIKQLIASMRAASPAVEPIQASALSAQASTGSGSGAGKGGKSGPTVGSSSGGDDFAIETPPVMTSRPPATEAPAKSGSAASSETVKTPTPAPSKKSAAVAIEMVAPAAVAVAAAAFTLF